MRRLVPSLLVAAFVVVPLGACGNEQGIGERASASLAPRVHAVRVAATATDRDAALAELAALRREVAQLQTTGDLSGRGAERVIAAALDVERQVMLLPGPGAGGGDDRGPWVTTSPDDDNREDELRKAEEDARKRAEDAMKKAEEEAKKRAEDARKKE